MAETRKTKPTIDDNISDVTKPGKTAPSASSKPILISNHPLLHDPMVIPDVPKDSESNAGEVDTSSSEPDEAIKKPVPRLVITPLNDNIVPDPEPKKVVPSPANESAAELETVATPQESSVPSEPESTEATDEALKSDDNLKNDEVVTDTLDVDGATLTEAQESAAESAETKHAQEIQKLVESKQYFVPIQSIEERRTRNFIIIGVVLSVVLGLAWLDVALDAGIIHVSGIHPLTHFFNSGTLISGSSIVRQ